MVGWLRFCGPEMVRPGIMDTEHAASERTTVDELVRTILQPYDDDTSRERIRASGPDVVVGATAVTSLALALHESATNAVKYGGFQNRMARSVSSGRRRVMTSVLSGRRPVVPRSLSPQTLTALVAFLPNAALLSQLGGKIEYDWQRNGLKLRMTVPLDRLSV